jgi:hypothetical protein
MQARRGGLTTSRMQGSTGTRRKEAATKGSGGPRLGRHSMRCRPRSNKTEGLFVKWGEAQDWVLQVVK